MGMKDQNAAMFESSASLVVTNSSTQPCTLSGYPKLRLFGTAGPMPTTVTRRNGETATTVTLRPGQIASSTLVWHMYEGEGTTCPPFPTSVAVTLPDQDAAKTIPWVPGDSGSACDGTIDVYPFKAGTDMISHE